MFTKQTSVYRENVEEKKEVGQAGFKTGHSAAARKTQSLTNRQ